MCLIFLNLKGWSNKETEQEQENQSGNPVHIQVQYLSDLLYNVHGGIKTGGAYMGLINLSFALNLAEAGLWNGSDVQVQLFNTHGGMASAYYIGDWQVISNIENINGTWLHEAWIRQQIGKFSMLAGIHDINNHFFASATGADFSNSSFGILPTLTLNIPVSTFPVNSLGILAQYKQSDQLAISTGLYDGQPGHLQDDPFNLSFELTKEESYFWVNEIMISNLVSKNRPGTIKMGFVIHGGSFPHLADSLQSDEHATAFHLLIDQTILHENLQSFLQIGYAPGNGQVNTAYCGGGFTFGELLSEEDLLGAGFAWARMSDLIPIKHTKHEIDFELFYRFHLNSHFSFQPHLHYIVNPGIERNNKNALAAALRFQVLF